MYHRWKLFVKETRTRSKKTALVRVETCANIVVQAEWWSVFLMPAMKPVIKVHRPSNVHVIDMKENAQSWTDIVDITNQWSTHRWSVSVLL